MQPKQSAIFLSFLSKKEILGNFYVAFRPFSFISIPFGAQIRDAPHIVKRCLRVGGPLTVSVFVGIHRIEYSLE